jgi:hypothetical protein
VNTDFQDTERNIFRHMQATDQIMALFDMARYVRSEIAGMRKDLINFTDDVKAYRNSREQSEEGTTQKIERILSTKFDFGVWFRDKVLPSVITTIVIALLFLVFRTP